MQIAEAGFQAHPFQAAKENRIMPEGIPSKTVGELDQGSINNNP